MYKRDSGRLELGEEEYLAAEVSRRPKVKSELQELIALRAEKGEQFFPQSVIGLCRDWQKTLDRARNHAPPPSSTTGKPLTRAEEDAKTLREL